MPPPSFSRIRLWETLRLLLQSEGEFEVAAIWLE